MFLFFRAAAWHRLIASLGASCKAARMMALVSFATFSSALCGEEKSADLVIIVNSKLALEDISLAELQRFFRADKTKAPDGTRITLAMHDIGHPERAAVLTTIYKMSETEYSDYFVEATFTGAVTAAPKTFSSPAAVMKFVADTRGAMSYVRASDVDGSVKVLKIGGKTAGAADYLLKIK